MEVRAESQLKQLRSLLFPLGPALTILFTGETPQGRVPAVHRPKKLLREVRFYYRSDNQIQGDAAVFCVYIWM